MKYADIRKVAEYNQNILLPAVRRVVHLWRTNQQNNMRFATAMHSLAEALAKSPQTLQAMSDVPVVTPTMHKTTESRTRQGCGFDDQFDGMPIGVAIA